jgi:hypothetical protein
MARPFGGNLYCGEGGYVRYIGAGSDFYGDGDEDAEMGRLLRAM